MAKITYANKVTLNPQPSIADENKVTDDDMNEIKSVVNGLIVNSKSIDDEKAYSCEYINNLNTYSNTEKVVGTWYDGKPLYQKTIYISALPNNTGTNYAHNISNAGLVFLKEAFWVDGGGATGPIPMYFETQQITSCYVNNTNIYIRTNVNYSNRSAYITLRYTKTTD